MLNLNYDRLGIFDSFLNNIIILFVSLTMKAVIIHTFSPRCVLLKYGIITLKSIHCPGMFRKLEAHILYSFTLVFCLNVHIFYFTSLLKCQL